MLKRKATSGQRTQIIFGIEKNLAIIGFVSLTPTDSGEHPQRGIRWDYGNNKVDRDRQFSSADDVRRQLQKKSAVV